MFSIVKERLRLEYSVGWEGFDRADCVAVTRGANITSPPLRDRPPGALYEGRVVLCIPYERVEAAALLSCTWESHESEDAET